MQEAVAAADGHLEYLHEYSRSDEGGCANPRCKLDSGFFQRAKVTTPPNVLVITVEGWRQNNDGTWERMFSDFQNIFSINLRGRTYILRSMSLHQGSTPSSGHYIALAHHGSTLGWFVYNDSVRKSVPDNSVRCHFEHRNTTFRSNFLIYECRD